MNRSRRGRSESERVEAARRQVALALGRDPDQRDLFVEPTKPSLPLTPRSTAPSPPAPNQTIGVLTIGEAAARLGLNRNELEAMIERGGVQALPTGYTRMNPTADVKRLQEARRDGG